MADLKSELDKVNDEMALILLPVIIVICICMLIGLLGNPLVAFYYSCHVKQSPSYHFIVAMAIFDIMICCVSMPLEIVDMRFPYEFPSQIACKTLRFVNYFGSISSGLVLVAIASDRYRKVCQPFKEQITTKMTKIIISIVCFLSLCLSWPAVVFNDLHPTANITSVPGLIGYDCTFTRKEEYKLYITVYNGVCFLTFVGCIVTLTVLYSLIGRKLCRLNSFRFTAISQKSASDSTTPPTSMSDADLKCKVVNADIIIQRHKTVDINIPLSPINKERNFNYDAHDIDVNKGQNASGSVPNAEHISHEEPLLIETKCAQYGYITDNDQRGKSKRKKSSFMEISESETDNKPAKPMLKTRVSSRTCIIKRQRKLHEQYIHLKKYTLLMLSISIAFVVSFLPYLGLVTWRTLAPKYERNILSKPELVAFNIFLRSWMISSVVNPIIYGFFNADFWAFVFLQFRRCCCCFKKGADLEPHIQKESSLTP